MNNKSMYVSFYDIYHFVVVVAGLKIPRIVYKRIEFR